MVFYFIMLCFSHVITWRTKEFCRSRFDFTRLAVDLLQFLESYLSQTIVHTKLRQHAVNRQLNNFHLFISRTFTGSIYSIYIWIRTYVVINIRSKHIWFTKFWDRICSLTERKWVFKHISAQEDLKKKKKSFVRVVNYFVYPGLWNPPGRF